MEESRFSLREWEVTLESKQLAPPIKERNYSKSFMADLRLHIAFKGLRLIGHYYIEWYEEKLKYGPHEFGEKDRVLKVQRFISLEEALKFFDELHYKEGTYQTE